MQASIRHIFRKTKYRMVEGKEAQCTVTDIQATIYEQLRTLSAMLPEGGHRMVITMQIIEEPGKLMPAATANPNAITR